VLELPSFAHDEQNGMAVRKTPRRNPSRNRAKSGGQRRRPMAVPSLRGRRVHCRQAHVPKTTVDIRTIGMPVIKSATTPSRHACDHLPTSPPASPVRRYVGTRTSHSRSRHTPSSKQT